MNKTKIQKQIDALLDKSERNSGASQPSIQYLESDLAVTLPNDYKEFLALTDGFEGRVGNSYVALWPTKEIVARNQQYEVSTHAPGMILFGSDGAGEAFGFDARNKNLRIVNVPFMEMEWVTARNLGDTFIDFLKKLRTGLFS